MYRLPRLRPPTSSDPFGLTPREPEVLALEAIQAPDLEIDEPPFIGRRTAESRLSALLTELGVKHEPQRPRPFLADWSSSDSLAHKREFSPQNRKQLDVGHGVEYVPINF